MQKTIFRNYSAVLDQVHSLVAGLKPAQWVQQPQGCSNHALWTLGHLISSAQAIGGELGLNPWLPAEWGSRFGPGSQPKPDLEAYPTLEDLLTALRSAAKRIEDRLQILPPGDWTGPLPDVRYRDRFPSLGHAVVHILLAHTSFHAGQLSVWRQSVLGES